MANLKLGKMEKSYGCYAEPKSNEDEEMVERFPCVYIDRDDLPDLVPGQEVTLKCVVTSFKDKKVRSKEDGKTEVETERSCELDAIEFIPGEKKAVAEPPEATDEDAVDKGLDEASEPDDESDDEE